MCYIQYEPEANFLLQINAFQPFYRDVPGLSLSKT